MNKIWHAQFPMNILQYTIQCVNAWIFTLYVRYTRPLSCVYESLTSEYEAFLYIAIYCWAAFEVLISYR